MSRRWKIVVILVGSILLLCLLFPIKTTLQDGGTTEYRAILYKVIKHNKLDMVSSDGEVIPGDKSIEIKLFPFNLSEF